MPRPTSKGDIKPDSNYLKDWEEYQASRKPPKDFIGHITPILLPVIIGINKDGEFTRERMEKSDVARLAKNIKSDLPDYMFNDKLTRFAPENIFQDYIEFFHSDGSQGPRPPTPLDLKVSMPVWMLFYLKPKSWTFSEGRQYSTENDRDDWCKNFEKIATMDGGKALLLSNRRRCAPDDLKFNLHVTITQTIGGKVMKTPIIIDPDSDNDQEGGGFGHGN